MPSSINTSVTLPVILAETVACRRAVTYPVASSTEPGPGAWAAARATAVRTVGGADRARPNQSTPAIASSTIVARASRRPRRRAGRALRSMRSSSRSSDRSMASPAGPGRTLPVCYNPMGRRDYRGRAGGLAPLFVSPPLARRVRGRAKRVVVAGHQGAVDPMGLVALGVRIDGDEVAGRPYHRDRSLAALVDHPAGLDLVSGLRRDRDRPEIDHGPGEELSGHAGGQARHVGHDLRRRRRR